MKILHQNLYKNNSLFKKEYLKKINLAIRKSDFINGQEVVKFENVFKKKNESKYCLACANGSDGLLISILSLGVKQGDEIITTSFSWIATSSAIKMAGARVIFCDIDKNSYNISVDQIRKKITNKTVGIIPVHLFGIPSDMNKITSIAKKFNLWVIEDCAQSHFAKYNNKFVGNFGNFGVFSFYPSKNIGSFGDAGCIVTNNFNLYQKAKLIANQGGKNQHKIEGINSRMDNIQAIIINLKLKKIFSQNNKRISLANYYNKNLSKLNHFLINKNTTIKNNIKSVFNQYVVEYENRDDLIRYLNQNNIQTRIFYKDILPLLPAYKYLKLKKDEFPNSYKVSKKIFSLPMYEKLTKYEINYVLKKIYSYFDI